MNGNWRTFSSASIGDLHLSCCILEQKIRLYVSQTTLSKTLIVGHSHVINRVIFVIFANENLAFWLWLLFAASLPLHRMSFCSSFCWFCSPPLLTNAKTPFALKPTGHTTINNNETWNRHFSACIKILLFIAVECSMDRVSIIFLVWIIDVLRFFFILLPTSRNTENPKRCNRSTSQRNEATIWNHLSQDLRTEKKSISCEMHFTCIFIYQQRHNYILSWNICRMILP